MEEIMIIIFINCGFIILWISVSFKVNSNFFLRFVYQFTTGIANTPPICVYVYTKARIDQIPTI